MEPNELSDGLEEQAREAEEELAEPAESDDMELTPDDLDEAAGGRLYWAVEARIIE